jgi:hypothetical protein
MRRFLNLNLPAALKIESRIAIKKPICRFLSFLLVIGSGFAVRASDDFFVLKPEAFFRHIERFNTMEPETIATHIPNSESWAWLQKNIPLFECPDREVEEIYYFRWWSFRKHIKQTPKGFVITEFLTPVAHAGEFNTISCAAGFHLAEGRWLRDDRYLNDYTKFWLQGDKDKPQPHFHKFSSWFAAAVWDRYLVNGDKQFAVGRLNDLVADYRAWETERQLPNGLFWQYDVRDGMEESISGSRTAKNIRPTINSYMFANARAIANIANLANQPKFAAEFTAKANDLKRLTQETLWDTNANFFKVLVESSPANGAPSTASASPGAPASGPARSFSTAREAIGYIPWMFDLPDVAAGILPAVEPGFQPGGKDTAIAERVESSEVLAKSEAIPGGRMPPSTSGRMPDATIAFAQLTDPRGFSAPFGLTTAERRHPQFRNRGVGTCEWDGAVWPFATSQTLYALANYLPSTEADSRITHHASRATYFSAFLTFTRSQRAHGRPYIGEYLDEVTGDWINRGERSRYYNHSTFADLLITGLVGLRPRADDMVDVHPLLPPEAWDWFCFDGVKYHGHMLTVIWDKDGSRYGRGAGLRVLANGKQIGQSATLAQLKCRLP